MLQYQQYQLLQTQQQQQQHQQPQQPYQQMRAQSCPAAALLACRFSALFLVGSEPVLVWCD